MKCKLCDNDIADDMYKSVLGLCAECRGRRYESFDHKCEKLEQ